MTGHQERKLEQVRALLDKAESTEFPEEAHALTAKAQELMTRHAIDEAMLDAAGRATQPDVIVTKPLEVTNPHAAAKSKLLWCVLAANGIHVVDGQERARRPADRGLKSARYRLCYATGFSREIDAAEALYTSLLLQLTTEAARETIPSYVNKGTWREHFIVGYALEVSTRLRAVVTAARAEAVQQVAAEGGNLLPVLMAKEERVKAAVEDRWGGRLRPGRASYPRTRTGGHGAGRRAGARADLGGSKLGSQRALGQ